MENRIHSAYRIQAFSGPLIWLNLLLTLHYLMFLWMSFPRFGEKDFVDFISPGGFLDLLELIVLPVCVVLTMRQLSSGIYLLNFYTAMKLGVAIFHLLREFVFSPDDFARPERIDLPVSSSMITAFYLMVTVFWFCLFFWSRRESVTSYFVFSRKKASLAGKTGWLVAMFTILFYLYLLWMNR